MPVNDKAVEAMKAKYSELAKRYKWRDKTSPDSDAMSEILEAAQAALAHDKPVAWPDPIQTVAGFRRYVDEKDDPREAYKNGWNDCLERCRKVTRPAPQPSGPVQALAEIRNRIAGARGHLLNIEAHGNAEKNGVLVVRNVLSEIEALLSAIAQAPAQRLPQDVIDLVIAARKVAYEDQSAEAIKALDKAAEAFASRIPWDDEPDHDDAPQAPAPVELDTRVAFDTPALVAATKIMELTGSGKYDGRLKAAIQCAIIKAMQVHFTQPVSIAPAPVVADGWLPIDHPDTPREWDDVLLYVPDLKSDLRKVCEGYYDRDDKRWSAPAFGAVNPTHWRPLPAAPSADAPHPASKADELAAARAEIERLRGAVWIKVGECIAGMSHGDVSPKARRKIEAAIDAALNTNAKGGERE
jgi:hypothetical protein